MAELAPHQVTYENSLVPETIRVMSAFLGRNAMPQGDVPAALRAVHATLLEIAGDAGAVEEHILRLDAAASSYLGSADDRPPAAAPEAAAAALLSYMPPAGSPLEGLLGRAPTAPQALPAPAAAPPVEARAPAPKAPPADARVPAPAPAPARKMRKRDRDRLAARQAREALQQKIPGLDVEARAPAAPAPQPPPAPAPAPAAKARPAAKVGVPAPSPAPAKARRARPAPEPIEEPQGPVPPAGVDPAKSVEMDWIVCLEDGKKTRDLAAHLLKRHGIEPDAYRAKWGLPEAYPMIPPGLLLKKGDLFEFEPLTRQLLPVAR